MAQVEIRGVEKEVETEDRVEVKLCLKWGYGAKTAGRTFYVPRAFIRIRSRHDELRIWTREVVEMFTLKFELVPGKSVKVPKDYIIKWLEFTREVTSNQKIRKYLTRYINKLRKM